jgi:hypothetical protein
MSAVTGYGCIQMLQNSAVESSIPSEHAMLIPRIEIPVIVCNAVVAIRNTANI